MILADAGLVCSKISSLNYYILYLQLSSYSSRYNLLCSYYVNVYGTSERYDTNTLHI